MNKPFRLLGDGFCYPRMLMPEVGDGDTRYTVQVGPALGVIQHGSIPVRERHG